MSGALGRAVWAVAMLASGCALDRSPLVDTVLPEPRDAGADAAVTPDLDASMRTDASFDGGEPDAGPPVDAYVPPVDAYVPPVDAYVPPVDAYVPPVDAYVPPLCAVGQTRCAPGEMSLETCSGTAWVPTTCALGCAAMPTPHCRVVTPSNVPSSEFRDGGDVRISTNTTWNTGSADCWGFGLASVVMQSGGGSVCVAAVRSLTVDAGATLTVAGSLPLVVLALGDITVAGTIDVSARGVTAGPGGGVGSTRAEYAEGAGLTYRDRLLLALDGGNAGMYSDGGGAGGSFCGAGGAGGRGGAASGGVSAARLMRTLRPLVGGMGGGTGSGRGDASLGGAGGGALQLSARGVLRITGAILAGGGGGGGGNDVDNIMSGAGGGSGGAILLEAARVEVTGSLNANGGGGGGASSCEDAGPGQPGADGRAQLSAAPGGTRGPTCSGGMFGAVGGSGAAGAMIDAMAGASNMVDGANGGGGGGGAGCIVIRSAGAMSGGGAMASPSVAPGLYTLVVDAE